MTGKSKNVFVERVVERDSTKELLARRSGVSAPKEREWADLFLVLLLLAFSGNPAIGSQPIIDELLVSFAIFLAFIMFFSRKMRILTQRINVIAVLFGFILLVQCISFSFFPIVTISGFFTRFFIGYAVLRLVKNFPLVYVRVMFYLSIMSLIFYIPHQVFLFAGFDTATYFSPLESFLGLPEEHFRYKTLFHTYVRLPVHQHRNAGMFWEAGALAGYLNLAFVFLWIVKRKIPKRDYRRYFIILSGTLFTTMSTAGYVIYPLILILHYDWKVRSPRTAIRRLFFGTYFFLPLLIVVVVYVYNEYEFLGQKISSQLQAVEYREGQWHRSRMGSIVFDWEYIKERPLFGWGLHPQTRYSFHPWMETSEGMGNGMSDFTAKFGAIGMLTWLFYVFIGMISLTNRNTVRSLFIMAILLLVLQGECFLGQSLFLGLMFLEGAQKTKRVNRRLTAVQRIDSRGFKRGVAL